MLNIRNKFPNEIAFEPLQVCNASCFSCPYDWLKEEEGYNKERMTVEQIENLLNDFGSNLRIRYNYKGKGLITPFRYSDPLITPYLENIFAIANKYNLKVQITTNARSFNKKKIEIFEKYIDLLNDEIAISVIGSNKNEIQKFMGLNLDDTMEKLEFISKTSEIITNKIKISLRVLRDNAVEKSNLLNLQNKLMEMGFQTFTIKSNWMQNRLSNNEYDFNNNKFVVDCNMHDGKPLKRIEVMVNGDIVLCCEDATKKKVFGNAFRDGIDKIWNTQLLEEHKILYSKKKLENKNKLICNGCSRAKLNDSKDNFTDNIKGNLKNIIKYSTSKYSQFI